MKIEKVGVVGFGFMGSGITQISAQAGYEVVVQDSKEEALGRGLSSIDKYLGRSVEKGRISESQKNAILARIKTTSDLNELKDCDIIIEVIPEDMLLKKKMFAALDRICSPHAILTSNTSCLSVTELAEATKRPAQVIGTHFLSPVPPSKLLEIVRAAKTSDETLETVKKFGASLGKELIIAKDTPGFVFNYLLIALSNAAFDLVDKGIATKEDIDKSMTMGLGHPIGPIALADFNGLDTCYLVTKAMYEQTGSPSYKPSTTLKKLVDQGKLGRKSGEGFYKYQ
ncbi:MAG: 3-hydroxyacyl-CoA dehydrogenase family protein [Dehalococcoidales bacterium]|nr:3-hydroxyacyl-CoA dehydrogenase family protein [Dehalococcoidales bacterium]